MPVYFLCGNLGGGKSLMAVSKMREKLEAGRPVATNINLDLAKLWRKGWPEPIVYRLPDFPTGEELYALGEVPQGGNEAHNGLVVLDEAGLYLNARDWNDKNRKLALKWFLHSRKLGWDVILITQSFGMVDKQVRESIGEYTVSMRRWDRMMVPMLGRLLRFVSFGLVSGRLPRVHTAAVMYGQGQAAMPAETWHLRGDDLFGAYQTKQRFSEHYEHGLFAMLPGSSLIEAADVAGELQRPPSSTRSVIDGAAQQRPRRVELKPKRPWVRRVMALPEARRIAALKLLGEV